QLETLELADDLEETVAHVQLRAGLHVLPAEEEAHQIGRAHRLDLATETAEGQPVDAGEQPTLAPFLLARAGRETPAERHPRGLELCEADRDGGRGEAEPRGERRRRDRTERLEPSTEHETEGILAAGLRAAHAEVRASRVGDGGAEDRGALRRHDRARTAGRR